METDREPFARLNADPEVMAHFPGVLDRAASDAFADRIDAHFTKHGFGMWAIEVQNYEPFIGYVGLAQVGFDAPFTSSLTPTVEIAWRLARSSWGHGYATEAARVACCFAFEVLGLGEIVSFTVPENRRSRAVMERIGMTHDEHGDFDHPKLPEGHPLRRHVLYRLAAGAAKSTRLDPSTATRDRLGEARGRARIHAQVQARFDEFELHQLETNRPGD